MVKIGKIGPHSGEMNSPRDVEILSDSFETRSTRTVAYQQQMQPWSPSREQADCAKQRRMVLDIDQSCDASHDLRGGRNPELIAK